MKGKRGNALVFLLLVGLALWLAGVLDLFHGAPVVSVAGLVGGGLLTVISGFLLMTCRPSGRLDHGREEVTLFCASFGAGLASIGLALSPLTHWLLPALLFAAGGVALMAWAPQAFGRNHARGG
jgi:hypothetical protein